MDIDKKENKKKKIEEGMYESDLLEGKNPIREALKAGRQINKIWVLPPENNHFPREIFEIITEAKKTGSIIVHVDKNALDRMSITQRHQGIIAEAATHQYYEIDDMLETAGVRNEIPFVIILDGVKDPYNLGAILRVADGAGAHGVIIPKHKSIALNASVARSSAGAVEHVKVARVTNLSRTIDELKERGFWIYSTHQDGSESYDKDDYSSPTALLIGSEGEGVSPKLIEKSDFLISIPMKGKINSLNVATATAVIAFEIAKKHEIQNNINCKKHEI